VNSLGFRLAVALIVASLSVAAHPRALLRQAGRDASVSPPDTTQAPRQQAPPPQQPAPQQPTFRAGVNAVRVDVIVTDRAGAPVENLTEADFEIVEDGKPQKIDSLKLIRVQTQQEPGGEAPREIRSFDDEATELGRDDVRIIVLFLDYYHVSRVGAMNLRGWLRQFIQAQIGAYDVVALMYPLTPTAGLTFTRDRFALTSVVDKFEGRRGDYMPRNDVEANYAMEPPWRIEEIRNQVVGSALKSLSYHLGTVNEGRKSVIVVAETLALDASDLREVIDAANRNNVAIYPLDARGLGVGSSFGAYDVLQALAANTNGRAITGRNDLSAGLGAVLRDSSAYYLLGYNSDKGSDGKFHEIKVRVKRPGMDVRARKGYWAPTAGEAARALEPPKPAVSPDVTSALASLAQPRGQLIRTWVGMSRGEPGRTRVTFVWEPVPPGAGSTPAGRPARVVLTASAPNGATFFSGAVGHVTPAEKTPAGADRTAVLPKPARAVFDVPPGRLLLEMTVEGASAAEPADVLQSETREIGVPDLARHAVLLSTPAVYTARTPREFRTLSSNPDAVPTASRVFTRSDRLRIRVQAYAPGPAPTVAVRLLSRFGREMAKLPASPDPTATDGYAIDLPLAGLSTGDYLIEIRASSAGQEATEIVAIRVTP
jgi:VWFA-related protein